MSLKAPPKEEIEISALGDLFEIGGFTHIEPQNDNPSQADPGTDAKTSKKPFKIMIPGIPRIEKQSSPDGLKGKLSDGKTYREIINERKPQLVVYQDQMSTIECPSIVAPQRPTSTQI